MTETIVPRFGIRTYRLVGKVPVLCNADENAKLSNFIERFETQQKTGEDPWRVACTDLPNKHAVSTVFLGVDHNYFGGDPYVFETAIFNASGLVDIVNRCSTWEQAEEAHAVAVQAAKTIHLKVVK